MKYPTLTEIQFSRDWIDAFGGYNHNLRINDAEFYEMKNMTGDDYPTLSPRRKRGIYWSKETNTNISGLIAKDSLCWVADGHFYINGYQIEDFELNKEDKTKQLISMGAYVIILPDKKYINTNQTSDKGDIEATYVSESTVTFQMTMLDTDNYGDVIVQAYEPTEEQLAPILESNKIPLWIDISKKPHALKIYSTSSESWSQLSSTYTKISSNNIADKFNIGDAVEVSGISEESKASHLNGIATIVDKVDGVGGYITIAGLVSETTSQTSAITIKRSMPDMDFVVESNNRLWGCKYYERDANGNPIKALNEIYACKLGDFKNWHSYQGTAMDSYTVTVGTDGEFTGAVTHLGYPIFFKENCMHKIYGNYPSNYQVQTTTCKGIQQGSGKSVAIVNNVLYYKSQSGVCAYDGSLPSEISSALGDVEYSNAVAGAFGNKYYIFMQNVVAENPSQKNNIFVYDTRKGMWHKEDNIEVGAFEYCRGNLYFINKDTNQIFTVLGTGEATEDELNPPNLKEPNPVEWEVITGTMGTDSPDKKYISRIDVRMMIEPGTSVSFYIEYDSSGEYEHLFNMESYSLKSFSIPVRPKRCDHMRLKIIGKGNAKIYSICKNIEWGSDK